MFNKIPGSGRDAVSFAEYKTYAHIKHIGKGIIVHIRPENKPVAARFQHQWVVDRHPVVIQVFHFIARPTAVCLNQRRVQEQDRQQVPDGIEDFQVSEYMGIRVFLAVPENKKQVVFRAVSDLNPEPHRLVFIPGMARDVYHFFCYGHLLTRRKPGKAQKKQDESGILHAIDLLQM